MSAKPSLPARDTVIKAGNLVVSIDRLQRALLSDSAAIIMATWAEIRARAAELESQAQRDGWEDCFGGFDHE